ncbi:MAG: redoxin domain-containing protein [Sarcina sp.]
MELLEYVTILPEIKGLGANVIAISPELPDEDFSDDFPFDVLSDINGEVANIFKILFKVDDEVERVYRKFRINLEKSNGNQKNELPIPATYIIDRNNIIKSAFIEVDYTKRLEPKAVLDILKTLKASKS